VSLFMRFARKYFEEAVKDLERAKRALSFNDYPQAVFYAQQCVEKAVKAMLEVRKRVVYNHGPELIAVFSEVFSSEWREEYEIVVQALEFLQEYYTRARYPTLFRGEVYGPSDVVTEEIARRGIELAERVVEVVRDFLRRNGVV